jgi:periplasmic protein TonB
MSGSYPVPAYNDRKLSASVAFVLHMAFFLAGGAIFTQSAEYGIEAGLGGIEVHLTAAPAFIEAPAPFEPVKEETAVIDKSLEAEPQPVDVPQQVVPEIRGDGSSPVLGKDSTTLHTSGGAMTEAKPNYLKNPAPRYPEQARRNGQEGVVMLLARVDEKGIASDVMVKSSSGHPLLDESALKAVKRWKFNPARVGSVAIDSRVEIPVRFELKKHTA